MTHDIPPPQGGADPFERVLRENKPSIAPLKPLSEEDLALVIRQPGVIAVSAFYEGFSVIMSGNADFELVAAMAEDLLISAGRIASQVRIGGLEQVILESKEGKFIIAPYRDLFLCVLTRHDANLGLVRLALRSFQETAIPYKD